MTCIVGIETPEGSLLAGDRYVGAGSHRQLLGYSKLAQVGPVTLGGSGLLRAVNIIVRNFQPDETWDEEAFMRHLPEWFRDLLEKHGCLGSDEGKSMVDAGFLLLFRGKVYGLDSYFDLYTVQGGVMAMGSGCDFALGALSVLPPALTLEQARANAESALNAAAHWTGTVLPPFDYHSQRKDVLG